MRMGGSEGGGEGPGGAPHESQADEVAKRPQRVRHCLHCLIITNGGGGEAAYRNASRAAWWSGVHRLNGPPGDAGDHGSPGHLQQALPREPERAGPKATSSRRYREIARLPTPLEDEASEAQTATQRTAGGAVAIQSV